MVRQQKQREEKETKQIALERIQILLTKADAIYHTETELALKYGSYARKIAMKAKVRIPQKWLHRYCRSCKNFLYPGINAHVRIKSGAPSRAILYCELCQKASRTTLISKNE